MSSYGVLWRRTIELGIKIQCRLVKLNYLSFNYTYQPRSG